MRTRGRLARAALNMAVASVMGAFAIPGGASGSIPPAEDGWRLVWGDGFDGPEGSLPSDEEWIFSTGTSYPGGPAHWGTGEIQVYTKDPANVSLDGRGRLRITPQRTSLGRWTSARIETRRAFQAPPGGVLRIEGRLRLPQVKGAAAAGYWPAFWALGEAYRGDWWNWPGVGEIDIMENVNGLNVIWQTLHCGVAPGGPCGEPGGIGKATACPELDCQDAFHTYGFEWDRTRSPEELRWYVNGRVTHRVSEARVGPEAWARMSAHGYFLLLNVAMGGGFPQGYGGGPTDATEPGHPMLVDYVAVYVKDGP